MTDQVDYDVDALLGGSVDSIIAKFSDLSDAQLQILTDKEKDTEKPRATLLKALAAALESRAHDKAQTDPDALAKMGAALGDDVAQMLMDELSALGARVVAVETDLAAAQAIIAEMSAAVPPEQQQPHEADNVLSISEAPVVLVLADDASAYRRIVFTGLDDRILDSIPALVMDDGAFVRDSDGAMVLNRAISFPAGAPREEVHAVWLVADGNKDGSLPGAVARMLSPYLVGGGLSSEIPKGFLRFVGKVLNAAA